MSNLNKSFDDKLLYNDFGYKIKNLLNKNFTVELQCELRNELYTPLCNEISIIDSTTYSMINLNLGNDL